MASPAHVIVLGNEKGGSGKSTTAMHIFVAVARAGFHVGAIDLDTRQKSFFRYLDNRERTKTKEGYDDEMCPMPLRREVSASDNIDRDVAEQEELERFTAAIQDIYSQCDFLIIDCPGTDSYLSRLAHSAADTVITPMNDSYIDFDLLARYDPYTDDVIGPSIYSDMVWECRKLRAEAQLPQLDWVVMRNRYDAAAPLSRYSVAGPLEKLATRIQFRIARGFAERPLYRRLFLAGLTVQDVSQESVPPEEREEYQSARREIGELIEQLNLPGFHSAA